jgi:lysine 2,3-aminomutase
MPQSVSRMNDTRDSAIAQEITLRGMPALVAAGLVAEDRAAEIEAVTARYAMAITPDMVRIIDADDPNDPIARQFVPTAAELLTTPDELADPIGDHTNSPVKGIVHRYPDRVLLKVLHACPVYCRFCFRREQVGPDGGLLTEPQLAAVLAYIQARPEIREVILTGGDPLLLSPRRLADLLGALDAMPHLDQLRIHSRVPVADPGRLTPALLAALHTEKPLYLAVHANHAREFTPQAATGLRAMARAGLILLGQSVLLRGVNDNADTLESLFRAMLRNRIKPYYLHQLDPAPGTARFEVPVAEGLSLLAALRGRLTGLAFPTYIQEQPDGAGKRPLTHS